MPVIQPASIWRIKHVNGKPLILQGFLGNAYAAVTSFFEWIRPGCKTNWPHQSMGISIAQELVSRIEIFPLPMKYINCIRHHPH